MGAKVAKRPGKNVTETEAETPRGAQRRERLPDTKGRDPGTWEKKGRFGENGRPVPLRPSPGAPPLSGSLVPGAAPGGARVRPVPPAPPAPEGYKAQRERGLVHTRVRRSDGHPGSSGEQGRRQDAEAAGGEAAPGSHQPQPGGAEAAAAGTDPGPDPFSLPERDLRGHLSEPPEPEAGEGGDSGVRRGLLEGAQPGGAPGGPPVPSPGRRGACQLLPVRLPRVPAPPGGLRQRRQPGRPRPALLRAARLPAPQAAPPGTPRSEAPRPAPAAGPRRPGARPRAAPAPPRAPGLPQPRVRLVPVPLLPPRRGPRRAGTPHRTAAAASASSQTRRGAQGPAAPAARFLETLALSFGGRGRGWGEGRDSSLRAAEGSGRRGEEVLGRAAGRAGAARG